MSNPYPVFPQSYQTYWCVICNRELVGFGGVFVHDDIPHPPEMDFAEEENPQ